LDKKDIALGRITCHHSRMQFSYWISTKTKFRAIWYWL